MKSTTARLRSAQRHLRRFEGSRDTQYHPWPLDSGIPCRNDEQIKRHRLALASAHMECALLSGPLRARRAHGGEVAQRSRAGCARVCSQDRDVLSANPVVRSRSRRAGCPETALAGCVSLGYFSLHKQREVTRSAEGRVEACSSQRPKQELDSRLRGNDELKATPSPPNPPLEKGGLNVAAHLSYPKVALPCHGGSNYRPVGKIPRHRHAHHSPAPVIRRHPADSSGGIALPACRRARRLRQEQNRSHVARMRHKVT